MPSVETDALEVAALETNKMTQEALQFGMAVALTQCACRLIAGGMAEDYAYRMVWRLNNKFEEAIIEARGEK